MSPTLTSLGGDDLDNRGDDVGTQEGGNNTKDKVGSRRPYTVFWIEGEGRVTWMWHTPLRVRRDLTEVSFAFPKLIVYPNG